MERPRQGVGSFAVAASVVAAASNMASKATKKRRAPPPPSAGPRIDIIGSRQSLANFPVANSEVGRAASNVPNTLER